MNRRRRLTVLGAGAIGIGTAALAASRGCEVTICTRSPARAHDTRQVVVSGALEGVFAVQVSSDPAVAIRSADVVLVAAPANAHRALFGLIAENVVGSQCVLISGMLSFGALVLDRLIASRGTGALVAGFSTTPLTARRTAPFRASIATLRKRVGLAAIPAVRTNEALAIAGELLGGRFVGEPDVIAIGLANVNPIAHLGLVLANFTRIERGEQWPQYLNLTNGVARLVEELDRERLGLARSLGYDPIDVATHLSLSFDQPRLPLAVIAERLHALRGGPPGPTDLKTRFILEDAPFGIWPTVALAQAVGHPIRVHESGLIVLSALYGRDLQSANDLLVADDLAGGPDAFLKRARTTS